MKFPPDFDIPWCRAILDSDSTIIDIPTDRQVDNGPRDKSFYVSMFDQTLYTPYAIRAQILFSRPCTESDCITPVEFCYLLSIGSGVDGKPGRAHGGFNALMLDQITGATAGLVSGATAPATATMTVDYKAPIDTPGVVLCRSWPVERQGRKTWLKGTIEDGQGKVLASAKALFIDPKPSKI